MTDKNDLLKITPNPVAITVPDWNDKEVYIVPLTGKEEDDMQEANERADAGEIDHKSIIFGTVMRHLTDEGGKRLFGDDDLDELLSLPADGIRSVFYAITNANVRKVARTDAAKGNSKKTSG